MNLKFAAPDAASMADLFAGRGAGLLRPRTGQDHAIAQCRCHESENPSRALARSVAKTSHPQDARSSSSWPGMARPWASLSYFIPHEFKAKADELEQDIREQGIPGRRHRRLAGRRAGSNARTDLRHAASLAERCRRLGPLATRSPFQAAPERLSRRHRHVHDRRIGSQRTGPRGPAAQARGAYLCLAGRTRRRGGWAAYRSGDRADRLDPKVANVREWFSFAQDKVPLLTKLYFGQEQFVGFSGQGNSFPILPLGDAKGNDGDVRCSA